MPPISLKRFSSKNIVRNNVINNNNTRSISNSKKLHRRQIEPSPVDSIPTVTISPGPVSFTLISANPSNINPTDIIPTNIIPDATPISTNINPTAVLTTSTGIISSSGIIPTSTLLSSGIPPSPIPTITTQSSSPSSPSTSSLPPPLESVSSNNRPPNNLHTWLFPILAISLLIIILAFLGFIYKKRSKNRNIKNNYIQDAGTGNITDKDKDHGSKTNSLTSSIHSVSSSFKIKKGRVVPEDINSGIPPVPIVPIVADNVADGNGEGMLKRPILKRNPTTVSVFREMVDLTDEENDSLRQSIASRLSTAPSFVHNIDFDVEDSTPSNAAIPLHQERINVVIPFSFANEGGGGSGSGTRTLTTPPFDNINNDNDNDNQ